MDCTKCHDEKPQKLFDDTLDTDFTWLIDKTLYFDFNEGISPMLYAMLRDSLMIWNERGHEYDRVVFLLKSYGGSYFDSIGIIDLIGILKQRGKIVEMRTHGYAMSGGFFILIAGSKGHRLASRETILMWHEVHAFKMPGFTGPSKSEDEAEFYRLLQDNANQFIADRSNVTKEELDEWIAHKEFWVTGEDALKYGFIDGYIN